MLYRFRVEDGLSEAFTAEDAAEAFSSVDRKSLERLRVGETYTDQSGDVWVAEVSVEATSDRDERLERVATAALQGLLGLPVNADRAAEQAVVYAKALIAELDKQA